MATVLKPQMFIDKFCSPLRQAPLRNEGANLQCTASGRLFPIIDDVVDFVVPDQLDSTAQGEREGNDFLQDPDDVQRYAHKFEDDPLLGHYTDNDIDLIVAHLMRIGARELCCLGAGGGMEVKRILQRMPLQRVYCSDIVLDKCKVVPLSLQAFDVEVGLFASDFDHCPWADLDTPVLIHQALHHTGDAMHRSLDGLLQRGYRCLILAEPTGNALIRGLRALGLAQRIEYSGVRPGRLHINTAKGLAFKSGYRYSVQTNWMFPKDYLRLVTRGRPRPERLAIKAIDGLSAITRPFHFGNNSVSCFQRERA